MKKTPFALPHRWRLSLVFMVTLFVAFIDRLNISYALPLMAVEYGWPRGLGRSIRLTSADHRHQRH